MGGAKPLTPAPLAVTRAQGVQAHLVLPPPPPSHLRWPETGFHPKDPLLVLRLGLCLFYMKQMNRDIGGSHFNPLIPCVDG